MFMWAEIVLRFVAARQNIVKDSVSCGTQVLSSKWLLNPVGHAIVALFAISLSHKLPADPSGLETGCNVKHQRWLRCLPLPTIQPIEASFVHSQDLEVEEDDTDCTIVVTTRLICGSSAPRGWGFSLDTATAIDLYWV